MRLGFVGASLVAHVAVVGLAVSTFEDIPRAPTPSATLRASGLVAVELTPDDAANPGVSPRTDELSRVEAVAMREPSVNAVDTHSPLPASQAQTGSAPPVGRAAARRAVTPSAVTPSAVTPSAGESRPNRLHDVTEEGEKAQPPAAEARADWLSIEQQLPESAQETKVAQQPKRDELVERLLAKEHEKQRIAQREEFERSIPVPPTQPPNGAPASSEMVALSARSSGTSYQSADAWVELTRWLPRAASSDQEWERLPSNTRFDVQVIVRAVSGAPVEVAVVGDVPAVVERLVERTAHLMQSGSFASVGRSGRRFGLRIRLSQTAERELWIAHTTPDPPKPGVGSFVSPSGRRFDVWVQAEP